MAASASTFFITLLSLPRRIYNPIENIIRRFTPKTKVILWCISVLTVFSTILLLNILTPLSADDFGYIYIYATDKKVGSFADIITSQINHYYLWGGRSIVHIIAQTLLQLPALATDILNTMMYLCFIFLIYKHIIGRSTNSICLFVLITIAIWFLIPAYGDVVLWITGSANYLWGTTLILAMMLPYRFYDGKKMGKNRRVLSFLGMLLLGLTAGWTNENTAAAMLIFIILFLMYYHSQKWTIPMWAVSGLTGGMIGYIIMITAPGNFARAGEAVFFSLFFFIYRFLNSTKTLFLDYGIFNMIYIILIIIFIQYNKKNKDRTVITSFIYIIAMLVAIYSMIFSPSFPSRAWFGPVVLNIIAAGIIYHNLNNQFKYIRQIQSGIIIIAVIMYCFSFYEAFRDIKTFNQISKEREKTIEQAKERGENNCEFVRYKARTKFVHTEEPTSNFMMSRYYEIPIVFKDEK